MQKTTQLNAKQILNPTSGLPVRTNLRAGLAWDDLDDQAAALWGKLTSAVSSTTSALSTDAPAAQA